MCGICGLVASEPVDARRVVDEQLSCLRHRGPDARGYFAGSGGFVAQNRLAIIDLVTGDPPITNEDESIAAVLNGEIYNFRELRSDLKARGHQFGSTGDTEALVHLAEDVPGVELARRLEGMFAFAIWDERRRRLLLGRDRLGKKPLFYWYSAGRLVFASEIKAIFADDRVPRRLDSLAIPAYLRFGYVPSPRTFFDGVRSLPPGHVLTFHPGLEPVLERYWTPPVARDGGVSRLDVSMDEAARGVRSRLEAAVRRRLVSDVPLGAFLSGGIDSSAVVGIMAGELGRPVRTFTIGFDDFDGFDERPYARLVATRHATDHHEFVVKPDAVELIERLVWHHDQPFGDSSAIPTFLLSEFTRTHVTVALSGDGGDELFAGYERFAAGVAARRFAGLPKVAQMAVRGTVDLTPMHRLGGLPGRMHRFARVAERGLPDAYCSWVSFMADRDRAALLNGRQADWGLEDYRSLWEESEGADTLDRLLDLNLRTYLPEDLLVKADRMSMAHGLEVRSPLLDTELLAYTARLRPSLKLRGMSLKRVLKAAVADLLPRQVAGRGKRGFGVPLDRWFREDLRTYLASTLGVRSARVRDHLRPDALDRMLAEHRSGQQDHGQALWTLITLEVFLRREGW